MEMDGQKSHALFGEVSGQKNIEKTCFITWKKLIEKIVFWRDPCEIKKKRFLCLCEK